ncbi:MAG: hypothetical protein K6G18_13650 [Treponema sp.]|nr:hypothetical protein [Treponema sp.]
MKCVKKVLAALVCAAIAVVSFAGCQFDGDSEGEAVETVEGDVMDGLYSEENLIYGYQ